MAAYYKLHTILMWKEIYAKGKPSSQEARPKIVPSVSVWKIASAAAIVLLALCCAYLLHLDRQAPEISMQTIHVPPGQRVEITLVDGTSVWLNA
ncbi:MAG: FecR family protein, partial [Tannerellaceae bacterium]|nr:FecR family protein [Tannerellaceae bacterium]